MSIENLTETGSVADTVVMPESPMATPEILENTPETPEVAPEVPTEQPTPEGPTEIELYQGALSKHAEDPRYQMSDEEADAFLVVQEQIAHGKIEDPGLPKQEEKPPEDPTTDNPEKSAENPNTENTTEANNEALQDVGFDLSNDNAGTLQKAMTLVGAKDITELDGKIEGLINTMKSSGGKMGGELKTLQDKATNHQLWLDDLAAGKPEALAYLETITGSQAPGTSKATVPTVPQTDDLDPSKFLDDELAPIVIALKKDMADLKADNVKLRAGDLAKTEATNRETAATGWVDDIVDLVVSNPKNFGLSPAEARGLAKQYWSPEGAQQAVNPKFQQMHELIAYAHKKGMPDLKSAYVVWSHENGTYARQLIDATKEGQKTNSHTTSPNNFLSDKQGKAGASIPSPQIDDAMVSKMAAGDLNAIPDNWMDEDGNLLPDQVPERFHEQAFGKLGKPK